MNPHLLELLTLGLSHLNDVPNVDRRAALLTAAADVFEREREHSRARHARTTAAILREAQAAQLRLPQLLTEHSEESHAA